MCYKTIIISIIVNITFNLKVERTVQSFESSDSVWKSNFNNKKLNYMKLEYELWTLEIVWTQNYRKTGED